MLERMEKEIDMVRKQFRRGIRSEADAIRGFQQICRTYNVEVEDVEKFFFRKGEKYYEEQKFIRICNGN